MKLRLPGGVPEKIKERKFVLPWRANRFLGHYLDTESIISTASGCVRGDSKIDPNLKPDCSRKGKTVRTVPQSETILLTATTAFFNINYFV